jgi:hypothetical protein
VRRPYVRRLMQLISGVPQADKNVRQSLRSMPRSVTPRPQSHRSVPQIVTDPRQVVSWLRGR